MTTPTKDAGYFPSTEFQVLIALAGGRAPCGCAPERLPSWPGSSRPSTQRRLKDEADVAAAKNKGLRNKARQPCSSLRSFVAPNHVVGRDKPGHDAFFLPPHVLPEFRAPRAQPLTLQEPNFTFENSRYGRDQSTIGAARKLR